MPRFAGSIVSVRKLELNRQSSQPAQGQGGAPLHLIKWDRQAYIGQAAEYRRECNFALEPRQGCAQAVMNPLSESQMARVARTQIQSFGILQVGGIVIRRRDHQQNMRT